MEIEIREVEIRGFEEKVSQKNERYIAIYFEEKSGRAHTVYSRNLNVLKGIIRGSIVDIKCKLQLGKYTNLEAIEIAELVA